jgi:hypothetical protein
LQGKGTAFPDYWSQKMVFGVLPLRVSGALPVIGQLRPLIKAVAQ